ncbi:hypothetical protein ACWCYZ_05435 [Streptomyces virginiae]
MRDGELKLLVQHVHDTNYRVYGARKIWRPTATNTLFSQAS